MCDVASLEADATAARVVQAVDGAQGRRLAGAVRADQRDDLALPDVDRDALQRLDRAVEGVDVLQFEDVVGGSRLRGGGHDAPSTACLPRYASITRGSRWTSWGVPSAIFSPYSSTVTRSEQFITTRMSCSIRSTVRPCSLRSFSTKAVKSAVSCGFIPAVGSSSSSSFGCVARARATSSRRWSP